MAKSGTRLLRGMLKIIFIVSGYELLDFGPLNTFAVLLSFGTSASGRLLGTSLGTPLLDTFAFGELLGTPLTSPCHSRETSYCVIPAKAGIQGKNLQLPCFLAFLAPSFAKRFLLDIIGLYCYGYNPIFVFP